MIEKIKTGLLTVLVILSLVPKLFAGLQHAWTWRNGPLAAGLH